MGRGGERTGRGKERGGEGKGGGRRGEGKRSLLSRPTFQLVPTPLRQTIQRHEMTLEVTPGHVFGQFPMVVQLG